MDSHTALNNRSKLVVDISNDSTEQPTMSDLPYNPVFGIICSSSYDRVTRSSERLEAYFDVLKSDYPEVEKLCEHYHKLTAQIEMDKLSAVISSPVVHHSRLNNHFNQQRQQLMTYFTESLADIENQKSKTDVINKDVNWTAVELMKDWFDKNEHRPFPKKKDIKQISMLGNITVKDIKTWFMFERIRRHSASME
ncbi:Hypothetical predicted protein [Mytilus galloprovincialis]|uniref:KN homeodomain domain-containing protein n=1 Tax=Mytilus galloprovincialis TaxID=29158 RepID=A0A8B6EW86_MYTGA|nr:Hypothetical predicted protein [Mytilus galloprovincialis]